MIQAHLGVLYGTFRCPTCRESIGKLQTHDTGPFRCPICRESIGKL